MPTIDFYYDFGSPNAYVAHKVLPQIAEETGAELVYKPILLGGLFKITGNQPPMVAFAGVHGKTAWMQQQMQRFLRRFDIPFNWNPHFPVITTRLMRGAIHARGQDWEPTYIDEMFKAVWVEQLKMDDPEVISERLAAAGLPAEEILAASESEPVKKALFAETEAARDRGAFGSPAMFVEDQHFFGKDSLDELRWYLSTFAG